MEKGIDISQWQENVDFSKVKKDVDFVILREGYGKTVDKYFMQYVNGCKKHGIPVVGVYHFCYSTDSNGAREEAKACLRNIEKAGLSKDDIIVFFDFEYDTVKKAAAKGIKLGKNECILFTRTFCDYVEKQGYKSGVYANLDYVRNMYDDSTLKKYTFWLADYSGSPDVSCAYHQYTSSGVVSGINGNVDMDYFYGKEENTMGVRMSNCGHDENGGYTGGKAGDQTGTEWYLRQWYKYTNGGWNYIIRWNDEALGNLFADLAIEAAENDLVGYDQGQRYDFWTLLKSAGYRPAKIKKACEADCSSGTIALIRAVGYLKGIKELQNCNATYTGDMMNYFRSANGKKYFTVLTGKYLTDSSYAKRGDINLNTAHHVNITVDNGSNSGSSSAPTNTNLIGTCSVQLHTFLIGAVDNQIKTIQLILNRLGYKGKDGKSLTVDGELGTNTAYAIEAFQRASGMKNINFGTVAARTWELLLNAK